MVTLLTGDQWPTLIRLLEDRRQLAMASLRLNFNVLPHLMEAQVVQGQLSIFPIMQTCRALQNRGASLRLRIGAVVRGPRAIIFFYWFMHADTRRYHALQRLTLDLDGFLPDSQVRHKMSLLFEQAVFLAQLSVHDSEFLHSGAGLQDRRNYFCSMGPPRNPIACMQWFQGSN